MGPASATVANEAGRRRFWSFIFAEIRGLEVLTERVRVYVCTKIFLLYDRRCGDGAVDVLRALLTEGIWEDIRDYIGLENPDIVVAKVALAKKCP